MNFVKQFEKINSEDAWNDNTDSPRGQISYIMNGRQRAATVKQIDLSFDEDNFYTDWYTTKERPDPTDYYLVDKGAVHEIYMLKLIRDKQNKKKLYSDKCLRYLGWLNNFDKEPRFIGIITNYCHETLAERLESGIELKEKEDIFRQLVEGLIFLHSNNIAHLDLKPENIMFVGQTLKIIDFGLAEKVPCDKMVVGTYGHSAPEQVSEDVYNTLKKDGMPTTTKCDMFALGLIWLKIMDALDGYDYWNEPVIFPSRYDTKEEEINARKNEERKYNEKVIRELDQLFKNSVQGKEPDTLMTSVKDSIKTLNPPKRGIFFMTNPADKLIETLKSYLGYAQITNCLKGDPHKRPDIQNLYDEVFGERTVNKPKLKTELVRLRF